MLLSGLREIDLNSEKSKIITNMKLWSIQKKEVIDSLNKYGVVETSKLFIHEDRILAYDWIKKQMLLNEKLDIEFSNDNYYPIWAWTKRPDLRSSSLLNKGCKGVLISLEIDESKVLLSDFYKWHLVLSKSYLPLSESDDDTFDTFLLEKGLKSLLFDILPQDVRELIIKSWERIFDFNDDSDYWGQPHNRVIQATIPKILFSEVISIKEFTAR